MIRGTTPTVRWKIKDDNISFSEFDEVWMSFTDLCGKTLTKKTADLKIDPEERTISYELTQEETLSLQIGTIETQLRVLFNGGLAYATQIKTFELGKVLKGGVIK